MKELPGVYKGVVAVGPDSSHAGQVRLRVPQELADDVSNWARIVVPVGGELTVPAVGTMVWVAFESGYVNSPVVIGLY